VCSKLNITRDACVLQRRKEGFRPTGDELRLLHDVSRDLQKQVATSEADQSSVLKALEDPQQQRYVVRAGVSLSVMQRLAEMVREWSPWGAKTRDVAAHFVKPYTLLEDDANCRFYELLAEEEVGRPDYFVSHMQDAIFVDVVESIRSKLSNCNPAEVFLWMDIFAVNQHNLLADLELLQACLLATRLGTLMVMQPSVERGEHDLPLTPLTRVWCIYELWSTLRLRDPSLLEVQQAALEQSQWDSIVAGLDVATCSSFSLEDKNKIMDMVARKAGGAQRLNSDVRVLFTLQPLFFDEHIRSMLQAAGDQVSLTPVREALGYKQHLVWLQGTGGSGKSTVSAALTVSQKELTEERWVVLSHFTKHNDTSTQDACRAAATMAYQLYNHFPDQLGPHYARFSPRAVSLMTPEEALEELLLGAVSCLDEAGTAFRLCFLVDALDEGLNQAQVDFCETGRSQSTATLKKCLENGILRMARMLITSLQKKAALHKVVLTSRVPKPGSSEEYIHRMLGDLGGCVIDVADCMPLDKTAERVALEAPSDWDRGLLHSAAGGSLVYYRLVQEIIRKAPADVAAPPSLEAAYTAYLEGVLGLRPPGKAAAGEQQAQALTLLQLLTAAREPMTAAHLMKHHGFKQRDIDRLGVLFKQGLDFRVYALHKTVQDFFAGRLPSQTSGAAWTLDPRGGHALLAKALAKEVEGGGAGRPSRYALRHAVHHSVAACDCELLDDVAGNPSYWEYCYQAGETHAVLDVLRVREPSAVVSDVARSLRKAHAELSEWPHMVRQRLYDTPSETHFARRTRSMNLQPAGRFLMPTPQHWPPELAVLKGHTNRVYSVAVSADGSTVVSGSNDRTVRLWDTATGKQKAVLEGHTHWVASVAVSADGSRVVSGSHDKTVRLWDAATGKQQAVLEGHNDWVTSVAVTADGSMVVSGSRDKTVRLWDSATGKQKAVLDGHTNWVTSVAVGVDGSTVVSGSQDGTVWLWDAATGKQQAELKGHTKRVASVAVSADGSMVVSGSYDKTVRLWDAATGKQKAVLEGHANRVTSVAVSVNGSTMVSGSDDKTVLLWNITTGKQQRALKEHTDKVNSVAVSADGSTVVSGSDDNTVRLWNAATGKQTRALTKHTDFVTSVAVSADGSTVVSGSHDNTVRLWDAATGKQKAVLEGHTDFVTSVAVSADGSTVASGSHDNTVRLWDASTGKQKAVLEGHSNWVISVAVSADVSTVVSGSRDKTVRLWDAAMGKQKAV